MEESSLQSSLDILEKDYDDSIRDNGGSFKRKFDSISSPTKTITSPLSPLRSPTKTMWLQTVVSPLPSNPSAQLERFLASCDKDVTSDVIRRAQIILEAIFPSGAEQPRSEALKLYYRVLEAMCVAEAQILHASNLTSLLTNERFHRCMLACSAESVVVATSRTSSTMLFPAVFEITGITAFDLSKVIESFIRHEESLPRELRRHLNSLEERLLESMVWEKGSSMHNSLVIARPALSAEVSRLGLLAEPMPSLDAIALHINFNSGGLLPPVTALQKHEASPGQNMDIRSPKRPSSVLVDRSSFGSPVKDRLLANLKSKLPPLPLQSAFASPARPNPGRGGETCAEAGINIFFGKINKLAAVRINGMVESLQQSQQHIRESVYRLFQQILSQQTHLFFNRHIDQIMLCCIFGVAKKLEVDLTFEKINDNYGNQPQCRRGFRNVFVDRSSGRLKERTGHDHLHIIPFYNQIFLPAVRHLLKEVGSAGTTTMKAQEGMIFGSLPDMSPKKVSAARNVYVSPLRTSKMDALISNGGRSYYACVGESTQPYRSPSKDLTDINDRLNVRNRKMKGALNLDNDVGLVSDSMVADSLFYHNGYCASSSSGAPPLKSEQPDECPRLKC